MSATSTLVAGILDELFANPVITQAVPAATGETIYIDGGADATLRGDNIWD